MTDPVSTPSAVLADARKVGAKKPWVMPALARIDSSEAELGANRVNPEGQLAFGS